MAKNIYRILVLVIITSLLFTVDSIVEAVFQFKYNKLFEVNEALVPMHELYGEERIQADKNFLYGIVCFISLLLFLFLWSQEKLITVKRVDSTPFKSILFKIFSIRLLVFFLIFASLMMSLVVFETVFTTYITSSSLLAGGAILFILNVMIFLPYLACIGIYDGLRLHTFIKFSGGMSALLVICMAIGIGQYAAGGIAALLSSFGFAKAMKTEYEGIAAFFELSGKPLGEQLGNPAPEYYPDTPIGRGSDMGSLTPKNSIVTDKIVFYAPKEKSTMILFALGFVGVLISFIGLQLVDFNRFELAPIFFLLFGGIAFLFAVRIFINRRKAVLLEIDQDGFRCIDMDLSYAESTGNALDVIYRLYIFPRYKRFLLSEVRRFEIEYDTAIGPVLLFFPVHFKKRMMVFYFDQHYTVEVIYNLLEEKRRAKTVYGAFNS
ncbi:hypothetical protein ACK8HY_00120 [Sphingobacterium sp. NGMCC 1.201703]|uniref:hypothetical protein n=1 Tax=Sphingobacterium sp. NGMCC 1.201703 TaxID=3388657 RepID=UPI0039FCF732